MKRAITLNTSVFADPVLYMYTITEADKSLDKYHYYT